VNRLPAKIACGSSLPGQDLAVTDLRSLLADTAERLATYRASLGDAPVSTRVDANALRDALGGPLPEKPSPPSEVVRQLDDAVRPGLVASAGPRYFGFVVGGTLDSALCADLLTTGWDQVAFNAVTSPAAAVAEEVAGEWLKELLGIPEPASFGLVTGGQGANTVALSVARHHVLARAGWDVEREGLTGAPAIRVLAGEARHATVDRSLRLLGLGNASVREVPTSENGRIDVTALRAALEEGQGGPTIVCLQAGEVNTGGFDDFVAGCAAAHRHEAWVHVDGAFGLWAAASPATAHLVAGHDRADSWACDGHKWLNVPYDCGYVFCAHPDDHAAAMGLSAAYLVGQGAGGIRNPSDFVPESSRRARGFATWAAIRQLGQQGVAELVERCCSLARRFASGLDNRGNCHVVNEVVLNQVLVGFDDDTTTDKVVASVQREGTCWMGATTWKGRRLVRISVSNATTTEDDVDRSVRAILDAAS
jgi:glutamate/tyrosine decarboxylase-like PLP-dependent enzyme